MARDTAAAPCGLWPPSSQISASSGASTTRGPWLRRCNRAGHSLGYAVLDGTHTQGPDVLSLSRPNTEVLSVELFTDGYMSCPVGSSVCDWEDEFFRVEAEDFH